MAYSVEATDIDEDRYNADLYMVSWDGEARVQLTHTEEHSEVHPRFSPDGKYLAFIASREGGATLWLDVMTGPGFARSQSTHWRMIAVDWRSSSMRTRYRS